MLDDIKKRLEINNFEVFVAQNTAEAKDIVLKKILPKTGATKVSYGDSLTVRSSGVFDAIKTNTDLEFIEVFPPDLSLEEKTKLKRDALHSDLFITGTNAVTGKGQLVNLDSLGNRVSGITFGPKHVLIMVGRNKFVATLEDAIDRIKRYSAPANAKRLKKNTPCVETGKCQDCKSPDRICNTWTITEKSNPKGRIRIIIINQDLGL
jgi:L-lactate utilization protein LutB